MYYSACLLSLSAAIRARRAVGVVAVMLWAVCASVMLTPRRLSSVAQPHHVRGPDVSQPVASCCALPVPCSMLCRLLTSIVLVSLLRYSHDHIMHLMRFSHQSFQVVHLSVRYAVPLMACQAIRLPRSLALQP